jgi:hypothetical protein
MRMITQFGRSRSNRSRTRRPMPLVPPVITRHLRAAPNRSAAATALIALSRATRHPGRFFCGVPRRCPWRAARPKGPATRPQGCPSSFRLPVSTRFVAR